jgi:hypothetical protein
MSAAAATPIPAFLIYFTPYVATMECCGIPPDDAVVTIDATLPIRLFETRTLYVGHAKLDACESPHGDKTLHRHSRIHVQLS